MERTNDVVVHSWFKSRTYSHAPVVSNVESSIILRRNCPQNEEPTTNSKTYHESWPCSCSKRVLCWSQKWQFSFWSSSRRLCWCFIETTVQKGVSRDDSSVRESRDESRAVDDSRNEPCTYVDSRNGLCVEVDFQRDDETFLDVRKLHDVTFLDVQADGWKDSASSMLKLKFQLRLSRCCSTHSENVRSDMNLEYDGGTDDSTSGPLAKSAEMKRLVGIAVANGTPIRVAYKDVRKRMRIEARRQKELDEGVEPEVVLDRVLNQVKVEQQPLSGPLKRVLTPSAKAAKHRCARDKKLRETLCWWIANDKVCPHRDRCNFRHTVSETGALSPSPAPEQTVCETRCVMAWSCD